MTRPLLPFRLLALAIAAVAALSACTAARPPAAVVGGRPITDEQLAQNEVFFRFLSGLRQQPCGQPIADETQQSACARFTLSNLIQEDLVKGYAATNGVTVSDTTVSQAVSQLEASLGGADKLDAGLKEKGITRAEFGALAKRLLLFDEVRRAIASDQVSDADLQAAYEANKAQFSQVHAAHILVKSRAEAERIAKQATPENFADLAAKYSTDTSSAQNGGDLGTIPESQFTSGLDATFVEVALALEPGEISEPVHTQFGWHVIYLIGHDVQTLDQVRTQLLDQASGKAFSDWIHQQLKTTEISVNPKYGRMDTQTGDVLPIRSTATGSPAPASPSAAP